MIGFIRRKMTRLHENLVNDVAQVLKEENHALKERLESIEEQLRLTQRQERRRQLLLDSLRETSSTVQATLDRMELDSPSLERLLVFAESFLLAHLASPESPDKHILKNKFSGLLEAYDISPIAEIHVPFNSEIHQSCGAVQLQDIPDGVVAQVVRPGFIRRGELLRAAVVMVNRNEGCIPGLEREDGICSNLL
jgi:molecular chaperone GrpE